MKKTIIRPICCLIVFMTAFGAYAQNKPSAEDSAVLAALPALPAIDTSEAPNDELTREIKKLLVKTNAMGAAVATMRTSLAAQRSAGNSGVPEEFYNRFSDIVENGRAGRLLENVVIKIYRDKFTAAELKEINKFYDTPVGKKLASHTVSIATEAATEGQKIGQYIGLQIARDMISQGKWK